MGKQRGSAYSGIHHGCCASCSGSVEVREEQGRIVIEPVRRKEYKLDEMLVEITSENLHGIVDSGEPVGNEVW
jgi:antitoxin MazE